MTYSVRENDPRNNSEGPDPSEIREQIERIRSNPAFDAPERARRFLTYVVEEVLHGRSDRIKAYSIAIEVFGRDASFDAQNDPVVRIEAGRVRRALEHYYLIAGQDDPIIVTIPKGGYVPSFTRSSDPASAKLESEVVLQSAKRKLFLPAAGVLLFIAGVWYASGGLVLHPVSIASKGEVSRAAPEMPKVVVAAFEDVTGLPVSARLASGLTDEVAGQMARFKEMVVVTTTSPVVSAEQPDSIAALPIYRLEGRVRLDDDRTRFSARLVDSVDGSLVWTKTYDASLGGRELLDIERDIASEVVGALAQPYGVIAHAHAAHMPDSVTGNWKAFACKLSYYGYHGDLRRGTYASAQSCLKEIVVEFPDDATAWALLALSYVDPLRFRYRVTAVEPPRVDFAAEAARRAIEIDPENVRALQADMIAHFFTGDVSTALEIGERALAINPNDMEFVGEFGFRLALSGQWRRGCAMISSALKRNPGSMALYQSAMALCSYMGRDYEAAERWARATTPTNDALYHMMLLAIYGQLDRRQEAQTERAWLSSNAPKFLALIRTEVSSRILRPEDQNHFIEGLRKGGLELDTLSHAN